MKVKFAAENARKILIIILLSAKRIFLFDKEVKAKRKIARKITTNNNNSGICIVLKEGEVFYVWKTLITFQLKKQHFPPCTSDQLLIVVVFTLSATNIFLANIFYKADFWCFFLKNKKNLKCLPVCSPTRYA